MPSRDPEAARGAAETPDPLLELAGWHAEPVLLRRLSLYIAEGVVECAALAAALAASPTLGGTRTPTSRSADPLLVLQLLTIPMTVSAVRLAWSLSLLVGYRTFRGTATPEIIKSRGRLQRRSFWTHSATTLTCLSCLIATWHGMMFLLLQSYLSRSSEDEKKFLWSLLGMDIFCIVTHWCFWRDFVKNHTEPDDQDIDGERYHRLEQIYRMYRSKEISIRRYQEVALVATPKASPASCMVCMEDLGHSDWVSVLPCGHYCHPACTNTWLCESWACPLRCEVGVPAGRRDAAAAQAAERRVRSAGAGHAESAARGAELRPTPAVGAPVGSEPS